MSYISEYKDDFQTRLRRLNVVFVLVLLGLYSVTGHAQQSSLPTNSSPIPSFGSDTSDEPLMCDIDIPGGCELGGGDVGSTTSGILPSNGVGNPINLMSGNKFQSEIDFFLPGAQLMFKRMYNSSATNANVGMGMGWRHSYAVSIVDTGNDTREIVQSNGARLPFSLDASEDGGQPIYRALSSNHGYLVQENNFHQWHLPDGRRFKFQGSFLVEIDWPDQRNLKLYYRSKKLESVTDETGRVLVFAYTPGRGSGLESYSVSRFGSAPGHLDTLTLPDGSVIGYDYDDKMNLSRVRFPDGTSREYHFEDEAYTNHITGLTDRTGVRFASWSYDEYGRAISSEHANGVEKVTLQYPDIMAVERGEMVETIVTNSLGYNSTFTWQQPNVHASPLLLSSEGAGCATCPATGFLYTYDDQGRLVESHKTSLGNARGQDSRTYRYDDQGRIAEIRRVDVSGNDELIERLEYSDTFSSFPIRSYYPSVNPNSERVIEIERDDRSLPVRFVERGWSPLGVELSDNDASAFEPIVRVTSLTYEQGQVVAVDGPRTDVEDITRFVWDERNRLERIERPDAPTMYLRSIDALGRVTQFQIGKQSSVYVEYGAAERVVASVTQLGRKLSFHYDGEYKLTGFTNPNGHTRRIVYNQSGLITELIDDNGQSTALEYDSEGRRIGMQAFGLDGALLRSVSNLFDTLGRLSRTDAQVLSANGALINQQQSREYDANGRLTSVADNDTGAQVSVEYNAFGKLASITEPALQAIDVDGNELLEHRTGFEYDAAGNEAALTDARNNRTLYLKDDFGRVVTKNSPDTGVTRYRYDAVNNRIEKQIADGAITTYTWDSANRMTGKVRPDGVFTYAYSRVSGKLVESVAPDTTEKFSFDTEARLIRHERQIDAQIFVTEYGYDNNSRISVKRLPDGQVLRYHFRDDEEGLQRGTLKAITRQSLLGLRQEILIAEIDQDGRDGRSGHSSSNGLMTQVTYAPDGSIVSMNIDQAMRLKYEFDDAGRIIGIDINGIAQRYGYSGGGLSYADIGDTAYKFDYDNTGNRVASSITRNNGAQEATSYSYNESGNRLQQTETLSLNSNSGVPTKNSSSQRFNEQGAPIARAGLSYQYDNEQRPIRVLDKGELLAEYAYNGFGERIRKVIYSGDSRKVTYFLYDGSKLTAEVSADSEPMRHAIFLGEAPVAYLIGSDAYAVHSDHLGTPRIATDSNGETVWSADYAPFGKATVVDSKIDLPYRFAGQYFDAETQTHYNYYRDYDPATGRYITSDPIGLQGGLNTYTYALNNPIGLTDPLGLDETGLTTLTGESPAKPEADPDSEESYAAKLEKVFNYAYENLKNTTGAEATAALMKSLAENAVVVAGVFVAMAGATAAGYGAIALGIVAAAGWIMAGYEASKFLVDTIKLALEIRDTRLCEEDKLKVQGEKLAKSAINLASELTASVLLGGLGKVADAVKNAGAYLNDGAFTIYRKLRALLRADTPVARLCSFAGNTLVVTQNGYQKIENIIAGQDRVWARDEYSGKTGWRDVLAQYSNRYEESVHVTAIDEKGYSQTIQSNRVHPYFARLAVGAVLAGTGVMAAASEGHVYSGDIVGGAWVDAQYLKAGDQLLSENSQWQTVTTVEIDAQSFNAYNLTVAGYATYHVAGDSDALAVWVHNTCYDKLPDGFQPTGQVTSHSQPTFVDGDGNVVYRGNDGRYYDINEHPPTAKFDDGLKRSTPSEAFDTYKQEGGDLDFSKWWSNESYKLYSADELHDFAKSHDWKDPTTGGTLYPPRDGFDGPIEVTTITKNDNLIIDRYSYIAPDKDEGQFFGNDGADFDSRAMNGTEPSSDNLYRYEVIGDLQVKQGPATAWFGKEGGGTQYQLNYDPRMTIAELIDAEILVRLFD